MPVNPYFKQYGGVNNEMNLLEDIFVECIQITGTEAFYIVRDDQNQDPIYGEDPLRTFTKSFAIEIYNSDTTDFEGQKEIFSKFGIDIKTQYTVLLSRRTFQQRCPSNSPYNRPKEGDLIWLPGVRGKGMLYEISFVNPEKDFFLLGRTTPYYYELKLEAFKYSEELINTGNDQIDAIRVEHAYTILFNMGSGTGNYIENEVVYQGSNLSDATASAYVNEWNAPAATLNVSNVMGVFSTNADIIGSVSGANYTLIEYDPLQNNLLREVMDNDFVLNEALLSEILTQSNPIGQP